MNHSRWHYIHGRTTELLDKVGYYNCRKYLHDNITKAFSKPDLQGWFSEANQKALLSTLETNCAGINSPKILEIGSWKGLSTSVIAKYLKPRNGHVYCVDSWQGNEGVGAIHKTAQYKDILSTFRRNMNLLGYSSMVHPLVGKCDEILPLLSDKTFDLIFIDADHRKTPLLNDLNHAARLVKANGIICGDDCDEAYSEAKDGFYREHCEIDYFDRVHCGVVLALHEKFGFSKINLIEGSSFWTYQNLTK
jgi:predicted O-methyltransferase YrrM